MFTEVKTYTLGQPAVTHRGRYDCGTVVGLPGEVDAHTEIASVMAVTICHRIVPWMKVVTCPELEHHGRLAKGICSIGRNAIFLSQCEAPSSTLITACHEAWHGIEARLPGSMIEEIESLLGPFFLAGGSYYGQAHERRARVFQHWCGCILEGMPPRSGTRLDEIFLAAWTGQLARESEAEWADVAA